ncbi:hypothetical protein [Microbacterium sp.]|uniref:hypothetical protein n=1 Tax=Microbacterium sp. TaxID=51671 RepID=UPI0037C7B9F5
MSGVRSEESLAAEAARRRKQLRDEERRHGETRAALAEANRTLLILYLREWLLDPRDFLLAVPLETVIDQGGRIAWGRVDSLVDAMLTEKPHYAVIDVSSRPRGFAVIDWIKSRSSTYSGADRDYGAPRATRDRPGVGAADG